MTGTQFPEIRRVTDSNFTIPPLKWRRRRRHRKQKRGKRAGLKARLRANPQRPAIPSLFLTNSWSLNNKMDELRLRITSGCLDYCVMIITETWLDSFTPDTVIELGGHATFRVYRNKESAKKRRGGLLVFVNNNWCTNNTVKVVHCCPDIEYMMIQCRPGVTNLFESESYFLGTH